MTTAKSNTNQSDPMLEAQAEQMVAMLFGRPQGYVCPQLESVDYRRCADLIEYLAASGRVEATPAPYGLVLYRPSAQEREHKEGAEKQARTDVLALVMAQPDVRVDTLADALPKVPEQLRQLALTQLLEWGAIRETDGGLVTAELAAERTADAAVEDRIRSMNEPLDVEHFKSTGLYREQSIESVIAKLEAAGDLARLPDGTLEYSTALDRRMRELVFAASESSFLKKARGVSPADVALELEINEDHAATVLYGLMLRGWFTREVRGNQFFYLKA